MKWPSDSDIKTSKYLKWVFEKYPQDHLLIEFIVKRYRKDPKSTGINIDPIDADLAVLNDMGVGINDPLTSTVCSMDDTFRQVMMDVLLSLGDLKWANFCVSIVAFRNASMEVMARADTSEVDEEKRAAVYEKKLKVLTLLEERAESMQAYAESVFSENIAPILSGRAKWEQGKGWSQKDEE